MVIHARCMTLFRALSQQPGCRDESYLISLRPKKGAPSRRDDRNRTDSAGLVCSRSRDRKRSETGLLSESYGAGGRGSIGVDAGVAESTFGLPLWKGKIPCRKYPLGMTGLITPYPEGHRPSGRK